LLSLTGFDSTPKKILTLLWRGSRDGFEASKFHSLCDGKSNTLTVVKTTTGCTFGGYTSVPWTSNDCYNIDNTAFLFTLKNSRNIPIKLNVITGNKYAVYNKTSYGPTFGGGHDFYVSDLSNTNMNSYNNCPYSYQNNLISSPFYLGDSKNFQTVEVEVFQVS
jgi:hypothetical protein